MAHSYGSYGYWLGAHLELLNIVLWLYSMWPLHLAWLLRACRLDLKRQEAEVPSPLKAWAWEFQNVTFTASY